MRESEGDRERDGLSRAMMQATCGRRIKGWKDAERIPWMDARQCMYYYICVMYSFLKCERRIGQKERKEATNWYLKVTDCSQSEPGAQPSHLLLLL